MAKLILDMDSETFTSLLGKGFHTAFRKASEHPNASKIWNLINDLPDEEWDGIIKWVSDPFLTMWGKEEQ